MTVSKAQIKGQKFEKVPGDQRGSFSGITRIRITDTGTTYVVLPRDIRFAEVVPESPNGTVPTFYLGGQGGDVTVLNIDGGTINAERTVVSIHGGTPDWTE